MNFNGYSADSLSSSSSADLGHSINNAIFINRSSGENTKPSSSLLKKPESPVYKNKTSHYNEPRIRMEVLSKFQVLVVMFLTYFSVGVALLSGLYELKFAKLQNSQQGALCSNSLQLSKESFYNSPTHLFSSSSHNILNSTISNSTGNLLSNNNNLNFSEDQQNFLYFNSCTIVHPFKQKWFGFLEHWSPFYGFFDLIVTVEPKQEPKPPIRIIRYSVDVFGEKDGVWQPIRAIYNATQKLRCIKFDGEYSCSPLLLFRRSDISCFACKDRLLDFKGFKVAVEYSGPLNRSIYASDALVIYTFFYFRMSYKYVEISVRFCLCILTLLVTAYYFHQLWASEVLKTDFLPERKCIFVLLLATFFYQNPLHPLVVIFGSPNLRLISKFLTSTAFSVMLAFYLFFLDLLHRKKIKVKGIDFYMPKICFFFTFWSVCMGAEFLKMLTYDSYYERLEMEGNLTLLFVVLLNYLKIFSLLVWLFWIIVTILRARSRLDRLPYITYRFRQLPFRFFIIQGWCVLIFLILTVSYNVYSSTFLDLESGQNLLGVVYIISVYNYLLGYLYLPVYFVPFYIKKQLSYVSLNETIKKLRPTFPYGKYKGETKYCAILARWLLNFAVQSYYDPKGIKTASGWGEMKGQLNLLDFISDPIYESHCLVALQRDKLVIAFRGSSCWKHLLSNFDFFKQLLPDLNNTVISQERFLGVHKGFWRAYAGLRDRIIQRVGNYIQSLGGQKPLLFVTGHSLGGALATFAAYDLTLQFQLGDLQMYNFGSPRVGNFLFALDYNAVVPNSFRIVFDGDLVVGLPQSFLFFQHVGTEIVVDRFGNVIINPTIVEKWLRTKSTAYSHAHRCSSYVEATTNSLKMLLDFVGLDFYCGSDLQALMPFVYFTNDELLAIFNLSSDWLKEEEIIEDVVSTPQQPRDSEFRPCKINSKVDLQTIEISKKNSEENNSNSSEDNLNELQKFLEF